MSNLYRKLIKLTEFQGDFKQGDEPFLNCCRLYRDNTLLATGGDDCKVRIFKLNPEDSYKPVCEPLENKSEINSPNAPVLTLEGHWDSINCVDFSPDGKLLVSSSSDSSCFIYNVDL